MYHRVPVKFILLHGIAPKTCKHITANENLGRTNPSEWPSTHNFMPPNRRFWKELQKMKCEF